MIMMNRSLFAFVCALSFFVSTQTIKAAPAKNSEPIRLTSDILKFIDGKKFGIDGDTIVVLCRVRIELRKRLLGAGLAENETKCCFYEGKNYTVKEMAVLEQNMRKNGLMQGDAYMAMGVSLSTAKRAFLDEIAIPILDRLRKGKKHTVFLIQESCEKHNRPDSILLEWARTDEEHEIEIFLNRMDSFKTLGLFCFDLIHLIGDIIHSCPIAYQQFEEMKNNYYAESDQAKIE
jgi:hypothetical protein